MVALWVAGVGIDALEAVRPMVPAVLPLKVKLTVLWLVPMVTWVTAAPEQLPVA